MEDRKYLEKYLNPDLLEEGLKKLEKGVPVQYIVGNVNFYGFTFKVNPNVLIPRFETEELVSKTYNYVKKYFSNDLDIADIGTGSGCIAITLKKLLPNSLVKATDISKKSLDVARKNAKMNKVDVEFYLGDLLEPLNDKFDLLISNPPYIDYNEPIMDIVKNNEPALALFALDGIEFYQKILREAKKYLKEKSMIAFEIGSDQGEKVRELAYQYFPKAKVLVEKDMQNRDRFVFVFNLKKEIV